MSPFARATLIGSLVVVVLDAMGIIAGAYSERQVEAYSALAVAAQAGDAEALAVLAPPTFRFWLLPSVGLILLLASFAVFIPLGMYLGRRANVRAAVLSALIVTSVQSALWAGHDVVFLSEQGARSGADLMAWGTAIALIVIWVAATALVAWLAQGRETEPRHFA